MRKTLLLLFFAFIALCSCVKDNSQLVRLAKKQMPATIDSTLSKEYNGIKDLKIDSFALVYNDDSICILQCVAKARTLKNLSINKQYRYYYLFNVNLSNLKNTMIFNDGLVELPVMPKEKIEEGLLDNENNHQSVYNAMYVRTKPIEHPVGNKYEKR